ncbi:MAG: hypothetical protein ACRCYS_20250, partial [Beijerinckiaceae bacterium]
MIDPDIAREGFLFAEICAQTVQGLAFTLVFCLAAQMRFKEPKILVDCAIDAGQHVRRHHVF